MLCIRVIADHKLREKHKVIKSGQVDLAKWKWLLYYFWIQFSLWIFYICASNRFILELLLRTNYGISVVQGLVAKVETSPFWRVTIAFGVLITSSNDKWERERKKKATLCFLSTNKYLEVKHLSFPLNINSFLFSLSFLFLPNRLKTWYLVFHQSHIII